jgi:hypothetical protein
MKSQRLLHGINLRVCEIFLSRIFDTLTYGVSAEYYGMRLS